MGRFVGHVGHLDRRFKTVLYIAIFAVMLPYNKLLYTYTVNINCIGLVEKMTHMTHKHPFSLGNTVGHRTPAHDPHHDPHDPHVKKTVVGHLFYTHDPQKRLQCNK